MKTQLLLPILRTESARMSSSEMFMLQLCLAAELCLFVKGPLVTGLHGDHSL